VTRRHKYRLDFHQQYKFGTIVVAKGNTFFGVEVNEYIKIR